MPFSLASFLHDALLNIKQRPFAHMVEPYKYIYGVVEADLLSRPIKRWFDVIAGTAPSHGDDGDRLAALESCQVVRVEHYRTPGHISHELVAVHIKSGDENTVQAGNADLRILVLERFKQETSSEISIEQVLRSMREVQGKNTGNADHITIGSSLKDVIHGDGKYLLVQAFDVPPRIIDVIDIAALANSITCCAKNYSLLHYMCMWWAAMFFHTCVRLSSGPGYAPKIEQGPLYSQRGMVGLVRLVDDEGSLLPLPPADTATLTVITKDIIRDMGQGGVDKDIITLFESVLEADIKAMKDENLGQPPVQHMLAACKTLSAGIRATLQSMKEKKDKRRREVEEQSREVEECSRRVEERSREVEERSREVEERSREGSREVEEGRREVEEGRREVEEDRRKVEADRREVEEARRKVEEDRRKVEADRREIEGHRHKAEDGWHEVEEGWRMVEEDSRKVEEGWREVEEDRHDAQYGVKEPSQDDKQKLEDLVWRHC